LPYIVEQPRTQRGYTKVRFQYDDGHVGPVVCYCRLETTAEAIVTHLNTVTPDTDIGIRPKATPVEEATPV
jgi:hypothetical protein